MSVATYNMRTMSVAACNIPEGRANRRTLSRLETRAARKTQNNTGIPYFSILPFAM